MKMGLQIYLAAAIAALFWIVSSTHATAQAPPVQEPSSKEDIQAALSGGVPMRRWTLQCLLHRSDPDVPVVCHCR